MRGLVYAQFLLISLALSTSGAIAEELGVGFSDQAFGIGYGFNPVTGQFFSPCIEKPKTSDDKSGGKTETYQIKRVTSSAEIRDSLNLNAYAATFGGAYKVNASIGKLITDGLKSNSTYFSVRVKVTGADEAIAEDISISQNGKLALAKSEAFFKKYCGDSFVSSVRGGGEFFALVTLQNVTEEQAKAFEASLNAAYGNSSVDTAYKQDWEKLRTESNLTVEIAQSGALTGSIKSLTNVEDLLEYARTFPKSLRTDGTPNAQSVVYQKYSQSVAFGIALDDAKRTSFRDFDQSFQIMDELVRAYDRANANVEIATDALSSPDEFDDFVEADVRAYHQKIVAVRDKLSDLARACANATKDGGECSKTSAADLVVPSPGKLRRSVCNVIAFGVANGSAAQTCSQVKRINGQCVCMECQLFVKAPYSVGSEGSISDQCVKMLPNAEISLSVRMNADASTSAADHWFIMGINGADNIINQANIRGYRSLLMSNVDGKVGGDGRFTATLNVSKCQSNVATLDMCTFSATDGSGPLVTATVKN